MLNQNPKDMTLILLRFFLKKIQLKCNNCSYYFLILVFMLASKSTTSQVVSDFTTATSNSGCGSLVVEFEDLSTGNPNAWLWDFGNGIVSTQQHPVVIYPVSGFYTISLTVSDASTNDISTVVDYIKVYEKPLADLSVGITTFCVPFEVDFLDESNYSNNIVSWMWDFGDGGSSNIQNPTYEYEESGLYTVSLSVIDDKGCESLVIINNLIDAKEVPVADFTSDITTSCDASEIISFQNNSQFATSYDWNFGDGNTSSQQNPNHNYYSGIYDVTLVADNGFCSDILIINNLIEVGATIIPDFTSNISQICKDDTILFADLTPNSLDSWVWDFGDGTISTLQNPTHMFSSSGNFDISLTTSIQGECVETKTMTNYIEVFPDPDIIFTSNENYSCDVPFLVQFDDNTINANSWKWTFENGDSSILQNPVIEFDTFGEFYVELEVSDINGCTSVLTELDYIITDELIVDFSVSDSIICESDIVSFSDSSNSFSSIVSYLWDFGDGFTSTTQNPNHQFNGISVFDITLNIENSMGCSNQVLFPSFIKTTGPPTADFTVDRIVSCAGETITFTDLSSSSAVINNWVWDFGDGGSSTTQNPTYQYNLTGNFDVTLITGEGICTDTLIKNYYIEIIEPSSFFIAKYNCVEPLMVDFLNHSVGADVVEWDFGDGFTSTDFDPIHSYSTTGVYNVSLRVTNNATLCTHEYTTQVNVFFPEADFTYFINPNNSLEDSVVCLPIKRSYIDIISPNVRNYRVDWGDGYLGVNRQDHLYDTPGVYDVTLMITDDHTCKDTLVIEDMFRVTEVETDFAITNVQGCNTLTVDFEDLSSVTSNVIWDFGNGNSSTQNNPTNVYLLEGIYDITLFSVSINGCKDTLERKEYVQFQHPELDFSISDNQICNNTEVSFTNLSEGMSLVYHWDFGDGNISTEKNPLHTYNNIGVYPLMLIITDTFGCSLIDNFTFIEVQDVEADFVSSSVSSNCPPLISTFTNQSSGNITGYTWDFGDGQTSNQSDPSHLYTYSDAFDVQLIIEDNFACKDTLILVDLISIFGPTGDFTFSESVICKDDDVEFVANVQNTDLYLWDFGDGFFSTDSNPTHTYTSGDYFHPILIIENSSSCQLMLPSEDSIQVREIIVDAGIDNTICNGDSVGVTANGNGTIYFWDNSPFITDLNSFSTVMFPSISTMFYVTNSDGMCFGTDSVLIEVDNDIPQPSFITDKMCYQDSMEFFGNSGISAIAFDWEWTILGENLYTQNSFFEFDTTGVYVVDLLVTNLDNGCDNSIQQTVEVLPLPLVDFSTDEVCFGEKTDFTNLSENSVITSMWSFGDGYQSSFDMDPTCQFSSSGVFNSTLIVQSSNGCVNIITKEVTVHEIPEIEFSVSTQCAGEKTLFEASTSLEDDEISIWSWDFGDNTILSDDQFTDHIYNTFGTFNVNLSATSIYGCSNSMSGIAEVNPLPTVDFTVERICEGDQTQFINSSSVPTGSILSYDWDFSEGNTSNYMNPSNVFSSGVYPVTLSVRSVENCLSIFQKDIHIYAIPKVDFLVDREVCEDIEVNFVDNTITDGNIISYNWDFGDRNTSEEKNPKNTYKHSGIYDISLDVETEFGCENSITKLEYLQVSENPTASFDMTDNRVSLLESDVTFVNYSDEDLFFEWDFDNGIVNSTDDEITITFDISGTYDVLLYVENDFGCYDEVIHSVQVDDEFSVFVPTAFTPNGDGLNDVFLAKGSGISNFEMKIYDRWGELVYVSDNIEFGWDGKINRLSDVIENGTYMYHIYVTDYNEKPWVYNGELNLMK